MIVATDTDLYTRGAATLLASWEEYARGAAGAALERLDGVAAAVFPHEPERSVYNNALLDRDLGPDDRESAIEAMEAAYGAAGVDRYAAWVHETDAGMRAELCGRGYTVAETTRWMGMSLENFSRTFGEHPFVRPKWPEHLQYLENDGVPQGLLSGADPSRFHLLMARLAGENIATAMAFDHDRDCGVFNVSTLEHARRRGLGTALTARLLHDARERGCSTASLQSTAMAERVYAAVGFRELGTILEYVPQARSTIVKGRAGKTGRHYRPCTSRHIPSPSPAPPSTSDRTAGRVSAPPRSRFLVITIRSLPCWAGSRRPAPSCWWSPASPRSGSCSGVGESRMARRSRSAHWRWRPCWDAGSSSHSQPGARCASSSSLAAMSASRLRRSRANASGSQTGGIRRDSRYRSRAWPTPTRWTGRRSQRGRSSTVEWSLSSRVSWTRS
jgi:GNAT superfamily N-acetyltransferase